MVDQRKPPMSVTFSHGDIGRVRHLVTDWAEHAGLAEQRLEDFILAVNEIVTNVVRHAGDAGWLRLSVADDAVCCEISDSGPGIPPAVQIPNTAPDVSAAGGRGLWLARRLCDQMTVESGPGGTTVRVRTALREAPESNGEYRIDNHA